MTAEHYVGTIACVHPRSALMDRDVLLPMMPGKSVACNLKQLAKVCEASAVGCTSLAPRRL